MRRLGKFGMLSAALVAAACAAPKDAAAPVLSDLNATSEYYGDTLAVTLASEYVATACRSYEFKQALADKDVSKIEAAFVQNGSVAQRMYAAKIETIQIVRDHFTIRVRDGRYAPDRFCPQLERSDVQEKLHGLKYLKRSV